MNREALAKAVYWFLCTLLILALFAIIFGLGGLFIEGRFDHVKIFASVFAVIGLIVMILAVHRPGLAWKTFLRGPKEAPEADRNHRITLFVLGACFVVGSLLYAYTGNIAAVIGMFFIFAVVSHILT